MKTFINDKDVIGKWKLYGVYNNKEDYLNNNLSDELFNIKEIYFLPNGEKYWIFSWTKGILYINDNECKYEIIDNKLCINYNINNMFNLYLVYEKINNKEYKIDEIRIKDDINIKYEIDNNLIGIWKCIDYVRNKDSFNPLDIKTKNDELYVKRLSVLPDSNVTVIYNDKPINTKYTKDYLIKFCSPDTKSKYIIKDINNKKYLIIEWKSGDYAFGGIINGYYVFEKESN